MPGEHEPKLRVAVDIGGTFTDVVLEHGADRLTRKVLTTPKRPEEGVLDGLRLVLADAGRRFADVATFVHGTTLATNAIIERRGARTALVATDGFRDVVEIANEGRYDQYDLEIEKPRPLVPRWLRFTVPERVDVHGAVRSPLDEAAVRALVPALREAGVESVAIAFLHGYANPAHERRTAEILAGELPEVIFTLASEAAPEIREYERTSTAIANAYVQPLMAGYLARMERALAAEGFAGYAYLVTSGGGLTSIEAARRFPVRLVESGPAGGAIFAAQMAMRLGEDRVLSFDMGGTTAKICLIDDGAPATSRVFEVDRAARFLKGSGLPLRIPVIEMVEIGAGGGSIAGVDALGRVTVGPESASSEPGPACYARGGTRPAVTDADVALGLIEPEGFAGGSMRLRPELSRAALREAVGAPLGLTDEMAAFAVHEMVCETMASAARVHAVERGAAVSERTLIAFGGAAPLHAARVAEKLGVPRVVIPPNAGVGSAVGFLAAPVAFEVVRSRHATLDALDVADLGALLDAMSAEALALVGPAAGGAPVFVRRTAYMRYVGQGHEVAVVLPERALVPDDIAWLRDAYETEYAKLFARFIPDAAIEILTWAVLASTEPGRPAPIPAVARGGAVPEPRGVRRLFDGRTESAIDVPLFRRGEIAAGMRVSGPAVIAEDETTTFVSASFDAHADGAGCIVMDRKPNAAASLDHGLRQDEPRRAMAGRRSGLVDLQVMWNRLIAVVEEQGQVLVRTAFSTIVRECGDISAGVFDLRGRMLAQAVTGTPGHINSMAESVKHFIRAFPIATMAEGDAYICNDPWLGTGHLNDFVVTTPVFLRGRIVALFSCTSHLMDIGGINGPDATDVFMEGLYIPMLKLVDRGIVNATLMAMIRANTRTPVDTEGDTYSLAGCNDIGGRRLVEMMDEFEIDSLDELGDHIIARSREAVMAEVARLPKGSWSYEMTTDGYDEPLTLRARLTVSETGIHVDFAGTAGPLARGINVPLAYTTAYTVFGLGCVVASRVPNNAGSLAPLTVSAPPDTILNAAKPFPVKSRHVLGQMLPDMVFGCLRQVIPERVPAEGTSCLWNITVNGARLARQGACYAYALAMATNGGTGARPASDGLSATAYPSGVQGTPVEIAETQTPLIFWRKELLPDTGGAGATRGGLGQLIEIENGEAAPFSLLASFDRCLYPPRGRDGGGDGRPGAVGLASGETLRAKGTQVIEPGQRLVLRTPGGGGLGDPRRRSRAAVAADLEGELVSPARARDVYGYTG